MALDISSIQTSPLLPGEGPRVHVAAAPAPAVEPPPPVMPSDLQATVQQLAQVSAAFNRRLSFSLNEKLGQVIVKVVDSETDKVVREIPPAELQHVYERIREVVGLLFDERA